MWGEVGNDGSRHSESDERQKKGTDLHAGEEERPGELDALGAPDKDVGELVHELFCVGVGPPMDGSRVKGSPQSLRPSHPIDTFAFD